MTPKWDAICGSCGHKRHYHRSVNPVASSADRDAGTGVRPTELASLFPACLGLPLGVV